MLSDYGIPPVFKEVFSAPSVRGSGENAPGARERNSSYDGNSHLGHGATL